MRRKKRLLLLVTVSLLILLVLWIIFARNPVGVRYEIMDLGTLAGHSSSANALNDRGQVVGMSQTEKGEMYAFIWDATQGMRQITKDGPYATFARDINNKGQAIGYEDLNMPHQARPGSRRDYFSERRERGFLWTESGGEKTLEYPDCESVSPSRINNEGQITGRCWKDPRNQFVVVWDASGEAIDFGTLVEGIRYAPLLNNHGVFAGFRRTQGEPESPGSRESVPFVLEGKQLLEIQQPEPTIHINSVLDINDRNQVLFSASTAKATRRERLFIWTSGEGFADLDTPALTHVFVRRFNDRGQVVGSSGPYLPSEILEMIGIRWEWTSNFLERAFREPEPEAVVWVEGKIHDLSDLVPKDNGWERLETAADINNRGQIVGNGKIGGEQHAFLLTPIESSKTGTNHPD